MSGGSPDPAGMTPEQIIHEVGQLDSDILIEDRLREDDALPDLMRQAFIRGIGRDPDEMRKRRTILWRELGARGIALPVPAKPAPDPKPPTPGFDPTPPSASPGSADPGDDEPRLDLGNGDVDAPAAAPGPLPSWLRMPGVAIAAIVVLLLAGLGVKALTAGAPGATPATSTAPSVPAASAGTSTSPASAAPTVVASAAQTAAAAGPCGSNGRSNGAENLTLTGAVAAHITDDCGYGGPNPNVTHCSVQVTRYDKTRNSYTYDMTGGFFANGVHYDLSMPGSGIGPSYSHNLATQDQTTGQGHVTMLSWTTGSPATAASVWQSTKAGVMSWTPSSVSFQNVVVTAFPNSANPQGAVTLNGTWKVYGCAGG